MDPVQRLGENSRRWVRLPTVSDLLLRGPSTVYGLGTNAWTPFFPTYQLDVQRKEESLGLP